MGVTLTDTLHDYQGRPRMTMSQTDIDNALDEELAGADDVEVVTPDDLAEPGTTIAKPDGPMPWEHQTVEFLGDTLEVRKPSEQALAAFSLASSKYMPQQLQNNLVSLFIQQHLSPESHERVFYRLMDPEDAEYTPATIGDLMREIATIK